MDAVQELVEMCRRMGVSPPLAEQLDREIRRQFGGDQFYVRQEPPRDPDAIRAAAASLGGERRRIAKLARQFNLSERRIRQILDA